MKYVDLIAENKETAQTKLNETLTLLAAKILDESYSKPEVEEYFYVLENFDLEQLDEAKSRGNLPELTKHLTKVVTDRMAGQNSDVADSGKLSGMSALKKHVDHALSNNQIPVLHIDNKPVSALVKSSHSLGARDAYAVHDSEKRIPVQVVRHPTIHDFRMGRTSIHSYEDPHGTFGKGSALDKFTGGLTKDHFKDKTISVKSIAVDKDRLQVSKDRNDSRKTDAMSGLKKNTEAAAIKIAKTKIPGGNTAADEAMKLHTELGKHIAAGDHKAVRNTLNSLENHVRTKGLENKDDKVKEYAGALKDIKNGYSWNKKYAKETTARLRGETATNEEVLLDLINFSAELGGDQLMEFANDLIQVVEDVELSTEANGADLTELSKETLGKYVKSASTDAKFLGYQAGNIDGNSDTAKKHPSKRDYPGMDPDNKAHKRLRMINKAVDKILKK